MTIRYSYGGDEHIFVEIADEMSLEAFFKSFSITSKVRDLNIDGVTEICPANASFQIRFNPDIISPELMLKKIQEIEVSLQKDQSSSKIKTRLIEVPAYYQDPWTNETLMRFRERHQDPNSTDLSYAAKINGYNSVEEFIDAHSASPWFVTMVGFVAGLPFMYQMVEREKQIEVPKYLRPRTDTPKLTIGYGGCFSCIYSVRGAGGYQMFGITPMAIYDPNNEISYLKDDLVFFEPGDIVKFRKIDREEYDLILQQIANNKFEPNIKNHTFDLAEFSQDIKSYNEKLLGVLYDD